MVELLIKTGELLIELLFDGIAEAQSRGLQIDAQDILTQATARVRKRRTDVSATQKDVLDILDGTKPLSSTP